MQIFLKYCIFFQLLLTMLYSKTIKNISNLFGRYFCSKEEKSNKPEV